LLQSGHPLQKNPDHNLVERCLKLSQILEYPNLNITESINKLNDIGNSLKFSISNIDNPTYRISMLNEHVFEHHGFKGDIDDYYNPKNNLWGNPARPNLKR